jgi:hypothetical protein
MELYIDTNGSEEKTASIFRAENAGIQAFKPDAGGSMFLRNVGSNLQHHTALEARRPTSTSSPP